MAEAIVKPGGAVTGEHVHPHIEEYFAQQVERLVATAPRYGCEITGPAPERSLDSGASLGTTTRATGRDGTTKEVQASRRQE